MHGLERAYFFSVPRWPLLFHPRMREERKNILDFHMDRNPNCGDFIVSAGKLTDEFTLVLVCRMSKDLKGVGRNIANIGKTVSST